VLLNSAGERWFDALYFGRLLPPIRATQSAMAPVNWTCSSARWLDSPVLSPVNWHAFEALVPLRDRRGPRLLVVEAPVTGPLAADPFYPADMERNAAAAVLAGFTLARTDRLGFPAEQTQNA
jgi:hypothetical protein